MYYYTHKFEELKGGKVRAMFFINRQADMFKAPYDLGVFDSEGDALAYIAKCEQLHEQDLQDPPNKKQDRLARYISHGRTYNG
jgi:hypothetical protein